MSKIESSAGKALYEQQETKLSQQSTAFIELLTKRGILGDSSIDDDRVRQAKKEKRKACIINTLLLLQHYPNHSLDAGMLPVQHSRGAGSPAEGSGYAAGSDRPGTWDEQSKAGRPDGECTPLSPAG